MKLSALGQSHRRKPTGISFRYLHIYTHDNSIGDPGVPRMGQSMSAGLR